MTDAFSQWMPPAVMMTLLLGAGGLLWRIFSARLEKMEKTLEMIKDRLPGFATVEQLGRMGDRMDGKITSIAQDQAVMKDRWERSKA